jgi:hypothetical protein
LGNQFPRKLIELGYVKEHRDPDGKIVYDAKDLADMGLIIRCMDCNHIAWSLDESIEHSEKMGHYRDVNLYKRSQLQGLMKQMMDEDLK